jgi:hypothetical protein
MFVGNFSFLNFCPQKCCEKGEKVTDLIPGLMAVSLSIASAFLPTSRFRSFVDICLCLVQSLYFSLKLLFYLFLCLSLCLNSSPSAIFLSSCLSFPSCSVQSSSPFSYMLHCPICSRCAHGSVSAYFNTKELRILPTQYIYVFHMILIINSDCFPKQY